MRAFHNLGTALVCLTFLFGSCVTSPIDLTNKTSIPKSEGIVFGKIKLIYNNKEIELGSSMQSHLRLSILSNESGHVFNYWFFKKDGDFCWHLPAGNYTIISLSWYRSKSSKYDFLFPGTSSYYYNTLSILAYFNVSKKYTTYVGTLSAIIRGSFYTKYVEDEFDKTIIAFKERFPGTSREILKDLMVFEEDK